MEQPQTPKQEQYIPIFWKNDNNNTNKEIDNKNNNSNEIPNINILTILRKYQKVFVEIETLISTWEYSENNLYIVFKNIMSFLERYNVLISTSTNSSNDTNGIKVDYFRMFNNKDDNISSKIEFELQLKIINKLEESLVSMDEYQREMKKVVEKLDSLKNEMDLYWETNIFSMKPIPSSLNTEQSSSNYNKSIYLKITELNQGTFSNAPITQIDKWFQFIINQFKLEYQRRDNLLKGIEYNKPLKQLNSIFENYEKNSTLSLNNIKEIIPKVIGVIKES